MHYTGRKGWKFKRSDAFDLSHTLRPVIKAGLEKYLEEKDHYMFGVPGKVLCDLYPDISSTTPEQLEHAGKVWVEYLELMIFSFSEHDWELDYNKEHLAKVEKGHELFGRYYSSLWW